MDPELVKFVLRENTAEIKKFAVENPGRFTRKNPEGNTILHFAARYANEKAVLEILNSGRNLLFERNKKGETPLHIVTKDGINDDLVAMFLNYAGLNNQESTSTTDVETGATAIPLQNDEILMMQDNQGNTPLHNAVRSGCEEMVQQLLKANAKPLSIVNDVGESPLSLAIDARLTHTALYIINKYEFPQPSSGKQTLLHNAVIREEYHVIVAILGRRKDLITIQDELGRNPLHYAASSGYIQVTRRLLGENEASSLAYQRDNQGQTPLHLATVNGHLGVLKLLHEVYPDAIEILDNDCRSILHIAAMRRHADVVLFIVKLPGVVEFINSPDANGNTPLHLAAMNFYGDVVHILSGVKTVDVTVANEEGQTALAIAESAVAGGMITIQKHLTVKALKAAYAKRALQPEAKQILESNVTHKKGENVASEEGKEIAQILSTVAILIATFTFTAAFTLPGGYNDEGEEAGMATLARKAGFRAFVITDTIAMTSSLTAAVIALSSLIWRKESESLMGTLSTAIALTWVGLVSMTLAFVTGLFVVLAHQLAIAIVVCLISAAVPMYTYVLAPFFFLVTTLSRPDLPEWLDPQYFRDIYWAEAILPLIKAINLVRSATKAICSQKQANGKGSGWRGKPRQAK